MISNNYDVVVVGAGIVGAACADRLAGEALRVALVDRGVAGGGATGAAMGHVVVMDDSDAQFALTRYSQELWMGLEPELPADVEYHQTGTLWIAADTEEMDQVIRKRRFYTDFGVPAETIGSAALAQLEPNLRAGLAGALLVVQDAVLRPASAVRFLIQRMQERGGTLMQGVSVEGIENRRLLLGDGTRIGAEAIVNATGVHAGCLSPGLKIEPRKGHLVITDRHPEFLHHQLVELGYLRSAHSSGSDSVAFNVQPRASGEILIGSSRQFGTEEESVEPTILSQMLQRAVGYMPNLAKVSIIRSWTGFRAATPDKLPLIGPSPENEHVLVATGHEGLGITTSLGTAALITDRILGKVPPISAQPYLPSRTSSWAQP